MGLYVDLGSRSGHSKPVSSFEHCSTSLHMVSVMCQYVGHEGNPQVFRWNFNLNPIHAYQMHNLKILSVHLELQHLEA